MNVICSSQDWWDTLKNEMEKSTFDKKKMADRFDELFSSLGYQKTSGQGMFHKKFIQVCSLLCVCFL